MFSSSLVAIGVTFAAADPAGRCFYWSRFPLTVISDYGRYLEIIFYLSPGHGAKDPSSIVWIRVRFGGKQRI